MLDKAEYSAFNSTVNSAIVSYRIVTAAGFKGPISSRISVDLLLKGGGEGKGRGKVLNLRKMTSCHNMDGYGSGASLIFTSYM